MPTPCQVCFHTVDTDEFEKLGIIESDFVVRLGYLDEGTTLNDLMDLRSSAEEVFSESHWAFYRIESLILPHLKAVDSALACHFMTRKVTYLEKLGFPTYSYAWAMEELADELLRLPGPLASRRSYELYQKSLFVLSSMTGNDSGYSQAIKEKVEAMSEIF